MVSPTDPNQVLLTGENSFMRLSHEDGGPLTVRASHWRVLLSPGGPGHVLFLNGEVTGNDVHIYTDNVAMTRWLQGEIQGLLTPEFGDQDIPVIDAEFERLGDVRSFSTESVVSRDADIELTWYDFAEPFVIRAAPGSTPGRPHGVYSAFIPARRAYMTFNGETSAGRPFPADRDGHETSTACLAWSETWVKPR
jgi:hypothetical protein